LFLLLLMSSDDGDEIAAGIGGDGDVIGNGGDGDGRRGVLDWCMLGAAVVAIIKV
jgi:hypothetical protein